VFQHLRALLAHTRRLIDVERRVDQLEKQLEPRQLELERIRADLDFYYGEFKRLKGRVTGGIRRDREAPPQPDGQPAVPATAEQLNALIRAGRRPF